MLTITLTNARLLGASAWLAALLAAAPPAAAQSLDEILAGIEEAMGEWAEHRAQTIDVKSISGLEVAAASGTIEQLQARLKSLLTKKRSNREWKGYWSGEAELAERLLQAYERVAPVGAEGPMDAQVATLKAAYAEAAKAARRAVSKVQTIADSADAARSSLSKALAETRDAVPELEQAIGARKVELVAASEPVARLEAAAAKADGEAAEAAGEAVAAAVAKRDAAAEALQAARDARSQAEALIAYLEPLLGGGKVPPTAPPADAVIAQRIETLIAADKALTEAQQAREAAVVSEAAARAAAERAAVLRDAFRARRPTLEAWAALARDKMTNQDAYLEAINADIAAVEERLRGMADKPEANSVGKSLKVCEAERRAGQSPLERYRECEQATRDEVADLEALLVDAQAADVLNERQASSVQTLLQAQDKDLALAIREVAISGGEARRATKERESERWRELWQGCAERAKEKKHELAAALQSTKDTARTITVNRSFFASERQALSQRGAGLKAKLAERSGAARYVGALLETAWSFIKNAYMVPVYLVLAWLLLKLIARVERRVVESAKRNVEGRDEEQRVDTLASVVRAALKLVVFVATGLLCLEGMGVDTGPILGGAAIFGLAISFGSQSLVKDFVTGFFILLENQYAVGDYVDIGGSSGTVESITMRRTVLRDVAGKVHNIPNGAISSVVNQTQGWSRVVLHVGVAYGTDLGKVEQVINRLGDAFYAEAEWADKLEEPPRYIGLTKFGASELMVRVMFKTVIFEQWAAERAFNRRIKDAFEAEGIEIPFAQHDVHIITAPPSAEVA